MQEIVMIPIQSINGLEHSIDRDICNESIVR